MKSPQEIIFQPRKKVHRNTCILFDKLTKFRIFWSLGTILSTWALVLVLWLSNLPISLYITHVYNTYSAARQRNKSQKWRPPTTTLQWPPCASWLAHRIGFRIMSQLDVSCKQVLVCTRGNSQYARASAKRRPILIPNIALACFPVWAEISSNRQAHFSGKSVPVDSGNLLIQRSR